MKKTVLLNWLPFGNAETGAARRAIELHTRLTSDFHLNAVVTSAFPSHAAPGVVKRVIAWERDLVVRLRERHPAFWEGVGNPDVWVTDTLPVPRFGKDTKTVLTVHDLRFLVNRKYTSLSRYVFLKTGMRAGLSRADAVVTVSEWIAEQIRREYGIDQNKLFVIPNSAASLPRPFFRDEKQENYILSVGHLEPRKDHRTLIRAFAALSAKWDGSLVIAGRGKMLRELQTFSRKLGISSRTRFAGGVSDSELSALYAHCTCLVCPSLYEGFGMTVLEGLAAGIPVIASGIPPHREVAADAVLWFEPGDHQSLTEVLSNFLEGVLRVAPEPGYERVERYNWDSSAEKLKALYNTV